MKKLLVVVLCLAIALTAVACSSNQKEQTPSQTPSGTTTQTPSETKDETPATTEKGLIGISVPEAPTGWVAAVQWAADQTARDWASITSSWFPLMKTLRQTTSMN